MFLGVKLVDSCASNVIRDDQELKDFVPKPMCRKKEIQVHFRTPNMEPKQDDDLGRGFSFQRDLGSFWSV